MLPIYMCLFFSVILGKFCNTIQSEAQCAYFNYVITALSAIVKHPNNVTTCFGLRSTFMCEVNDSSFPIAMDWVVNGSLIGERIEGASVYTIASNTSVQFFLVLPGWFYAATVKCNPATYLGETSSTGYLSVQGLPYAWMK